MTPRGRRTPPPNDLTRRPTVCSPFVCPAAPRVDETWHDLTRPEQERIIGRPDAHIRVATPRTAGVALLRRGYDDTERGEVQRPVLDREHDGDVRADVGEARTKCRNAAGGSAAAAVAKTRPARCRRRHRHASSSSAAVSSRRGRDV